jgi:hypothetical protein
LNQKHPLSSPETHIITGALSAMILKSSFSLNSSWNFHFFSVGFFATGSMRTEVESKRRNLTAPRGVPI